MICPDMLLAKENQVEYKKKKVGIVVVPKTKPKKPKTTTPKIKKGIYRGKPIAKKPKKKYT